MQQWIRDDGARPFDPQAAQVEVLYSQSAVTFLFPILAVPILWTVLWDVGRHPLLLGWGGIVIAYSTARCLLIWRWHGVARDACEAGEWLNLFAAGVFLSGLLWGAAPLLLIPHNPAQPIAFTLYTGLTVVLICGLVAGAVVSYSICTRVLCCYAVPALLPAALYLVAIGDRYNSALGGFVFFYLAFALLASLRFRSQLLDAARRVHDRDLLDAELERLRALLKPALPAAAAPVQDVAIRRTSRRG